VQATYIAMEQVYKQIYTSFIAKLVRNLPMNDEAFIKTLLDEHFLPGNTSSTIESLATQAEKSLYFLNHIIEPSLDVGLTSSFDTLIDIMSNHTETDVQKLAAKIKDEITTKTASCM